MLTLYVPTERPLAAALQVEAPLKVPVRVQSVWPPEMKIIVPVGAVECAPAAGVKVKPMVQTEPARIEVPQVVNPKSTAKCESVVEKGLVMFRLSVPTLVMVWVMT